MAVRDAVIFCVVDHCVAVRCGAGQPGCVRYGVSPIGHHLPYLRLNLAQAPEPLLRALFEATRLTIDLHEHSDDATITVTLPADELPTIAAAARELPAKPPTQPADQGASGDRQFVDAVGAPGGIRTHTVTLLRGLPLPLGYGGAGSAYGSPPAAAAARRSTSSSIAGVSRPVKVFCWLTW